MNRKTLPLLLAALLSPLASAEVSITGSLRSAIDYVHLEGATDPAKNPDANKLRIVDQSSRITFKGIDPLEGGVNLVWWVESGFNAGIGESDGLIGSRNVFIGLQKDDLGFLRLGKYDNAYKLWTGDAVPAVDGTLTDDSSYFGGKRILRRIGHRPDQVVSYESPVVGGFKVRLDHDFDPGQSGSTNANTSTAGVTYLHPNFTFGVAYAVAEDFVIKPGSVSLKAKNERTPGTQIDGLMVGGSAIYGGLTVSALFERVNWDNGKKDWQQDSWGAGVMYKSGKYTFLGTYAQAGDLTGSAESGAQQYSIGARYALSKNSSLNLTYAILENQKNAAFHTESPDVVVGKGQDAQFVTLGLRTNF